MAKVHVLTTSGGYSRVVFHIPIPVANNTAGTPWATALKNSGLARTALVDGDGTGGSIDATEKTAITNGTTYETEASIQIPTGLTSAQYNAYFDALHADKVDEITGLGSALRLRLDYFGYRRL